MLVYILYFVTLVNSRIDCRVHSLSIFLSLEKKKKNPVLSIRNKTRRHEAHFPQLTSFLAPNTNLFFLFWSFQKIAINFVLSLPFNKKQKQVRKKKNYFLFQVILTYHLVSVRFIKLILNSKFVLQGNRTMEKGCKICEKYKEHYYEDHLNGKNVEFYELMHGDFSQHLVTIFIHFCLLSPQKMEKENERK